MTIAALQHTYPEWDGPPRDPDDGYPVWPGVMRIVRSRRRMRALRRRGVPMMHLGYGDGTPAQQPVGPGIYGPGTRTAQGPWAWYVKVNIPKRSTP